MASDDELPPPQRPFPTWTNRRRRSAIATSVSTLSAAELPVYIEARKFVDKVKARFPNEPSKSAEFIRIVREYRDGGFNPMEASSKMATLFRNHLDLYNDFKSFLPADVEPPEVPEEQNPPSQYIDAKQFVSKVKATFGANSQATGEFLDTLKMFKDGKAHAVEVFVKISDLFRNHRDLYENFKKFLPPHFVTPTLAQVQNAEEALAPVLNVRAD